MIDFTGKDQSWWPDLAGRTVAILASGPSMTQAQCDLVGATDWFAVAINETWRLAPWAHTLYGCDWEWWASLAPKVEEFRGTRVIGTVPNIRNKPQFPPEMEGQAAQLQYLRVVAGQTQPLWNGPAVGAGSNSAFQVANWVARCGATRLVLLGVDCHSPNAHWHGIHKHPLAKNQKPNLMKAWLMAWRNAAPQFTERGISVVNCSPGSAVDCFPRANLEKVAA